MQHPPDDALEQNAPSLAVLGEPVRRRLYRFVAASQEPVSREQASAGVDVAAHTAKFHLDKLVDEGLLDVEYRRLTGRTGPGAGRPAKLYRRSDREFALSLPERHYDLIGTILAEAVDTALDEGAPVDEVAAKVARRHGEAYGAQSKEESKEQSSGDRSGDATVDSLDRLAGVLEDRGYEPVLENGQMVLENCPFDRIAKRHTALVCGLNLDYVEGVAAGLGCCDVEAHLEPGAGRCCVSARLRGA